MLILLVMCIPMTSCSDDDEDEPAPVPTPEYTLKNTTWVYETTETDDDGDITKTTRTVSFGETTATYSIDLDFFYSYGGSSHMPIMENKYTFTYKNNTAVLTPSGNENDEELAKLTADVTPGVKLVLTNASNNEVIGTFFTE